MTIHEIHREAIAYPNGTTSYKWRIEINWPPNGYFAFRSDGFTQEALGPPVSCEKQYLTATERSQT
jgi:hypothetical protein